MKSIWLNNDSPLINKSDLKKIQSKLDEIKAPSTIGRMPRKIEHGYAGFTADQWKTWTILFSVYALWDILPPAHLEVWRDFVMACTLYCCPTITRMKAEVHTPTS